MVSPLESFISGRQAAVQQKRSDLGLQQDQMAMQANQMNTKIKQAELLSNSIDAIQRSSADPAQRMQIAQRLLPELQRFGVQLDPGNMTIDDFTDAGLQREKAELTGFLANPEESMSKIQQAVAIPGVGFQTLTRTGEVGLQTLSPEQQQQVETAFEAEAQRKARAAGLRSGAAETGKITAREETETGRAELQRAQVDVQAAKQKMEQDIKKAEQSLSGRDIDAQTAIQNIDNLLAGGYRDIYGMAEGRLPELFRSQSAIDSMALRDQVVGLLSLENRQKLKGQGTITDNEAATLERAATVLANPKISDTLAEQELKRVKEIFGRVSKKTQQPTDQNIFTAPSGRQIEFTVE